MPLSKQAEHRQRTGLIAITCLVLSGLVACGPTDSGAEAGGSSVSQPSRDELPPGLAALLDSGTVAYRAGDYEAARGHYMAAADQAPEVASTWFGVYLAESALGNGDAAAEAMERFRELGGAADMHHTPHGDSTPDVGDDQGDDQTEAMQTRSS